MSTLKNKFDKGKTRAVNKVYHSLNSVRHKTRNPKLRRANLIKMRQLNPKNTQDPNFRRLLYVRYADDFVILIIGSLREAYSIRRKIRDFLLHKLGLKLNLDKTNICRVREGFAFLGAWLFSAGPVVSRINRKDSKVIHKRSPRRLIVNAPLKGLIDKMIINKFARINAKSSVLAKGRKDLINLSHYQILNTYNNKIRGLLNFYSFAANYSSLRKIS